MKAKEMMIPLTEAAIDPGSEFAGDFCFTFFFWLHILLRAHQRSHTYTHVHTHTRTHKHTRTYAHICSERRLRSGHGCPFSRSGSRVFPCRRCVRTAERVCLFVCQLCIIFPCNTSKSAFFRLSLQKYTSVFANMSTRLGMDTRDFGLTKWPSVSIFEQCCCKVSRGRYFGCNLSSDHQVAVARVRLRGSLTTMVARRPRNLWSARLVLSRATRGSLTIFLQSANTRAAW